MILRDYQQGAVDAVFRYWSEGGGSPLMDLATGLGKSVIIAKLLTDLVTNYPAMRILVLVHVQELVEQDYRALIRMWPQAPAGIYSAGLGRRDAHHQITFASIQSVYRKARALGPRDLVLVDEAHLVPASGAGMYLTLFSALRDMRPDMRVAGLTATAFRLDSGRLDRGEGRLFDETVYHYGVGEGVDDGWLAPLTCRAASIEIDVSDVARRGGEFVAGALEAAADRDDLTRAAVTEIVKRGQDRRSWLVFCSGVKHAAHVCQAIQAAGFTAGVVTGETPKHDRARMIEDFKAGRLRALTNAQVLTTGFDAPQTDLIAFLRPTLSTGLYVQMLGRGTRPVYPPGFDPNAATQAERVEAIAASTKPNCLAAGQRVLTDHGLVPIEDVTSFMRVWDGENFVYCGGSVCNGEKEVIEYAGIVGTPDHRVWTVKGWATLRQCAEQQTAVAVTGDGWKTIPLSNGHFRRGDARRSWSSRACDAMREMRESLHEGLHEFGKAHSGVQMLATPGGSPMAAHALHRCKATVHKLGEQALRGLWWSRYRVSVRDANPDGAMDTPEPRRETRFGNRPTQQQRPLRAWKFTLGHVSRKSGQQAPRRKTAKVYDIVNAGPNNRFTIEGVLVHNCLVLDFAGNVRRHGPVDAVVTSDKKKRAGEEDDLEVKAKVDSVRAKECPNCMTLLGLAALSCPTCGFEFPAPEPKHEAKPDEEIALLSRDMKPSPVLEYPVVNWTAQRHEKIGSPPSMRVTFYAGLAAYNEWICFEHTGFARHKAWKWWLEHGGGTPEPATIDEALQRFVTLRRPDAIFVKREGRFDEIVARRFKTEEAA